MNSWKHVSTQAVRFFVLLLALGLLGGRTASGRAAGGQPITGFYRILDATDLGSDARVTLDIRLANSGEDRVFVTGVSLLGFPHAGQSAQASASVILEPHSSESFTQEFTVSRKEYQLLGRGRVRPVLSLNVQIGGNAETTLTIALMRRPG
jgi:hypothetical protein